jgi:hypothetical protein
MKKKYNAIKYYCVTEANATGIIQILEINGTYNLADISSKLLPGAQLPDISWKKLCDCDGIAHHVLKGHLNYLIRDSL